MSVTDSYSELEVVSKEMSNSVTESTSTIDSKLASPQDSPRVSTSAQPPEDMTGIRVDTALPTAKPTGKASIATVLDSHGNTSGMRDITPEDYSADPMLASAIASPLHDPLNIDAMFFPTRPALTREPSILKKAHSIGDEWELYKRAGPKYPASLDQLVMKYHQKHSDSWQLAHDLGAGSGVYAPTLARFFRHVHISDPTSNGLKTSRTLLSASAAENAKKRGRFTFSVAKPEEAADCAADGTVDFAILTECAHFTNADAMIKSVAASLAPGGTLAIITHRPIASVVGNNQVKAAVDRLYDAWGRKPWEVACGDTARSRQQFGLGLDFVPLPEELFKREETRRITINTRGKPHLVFRAPFDASEDEEDLRMSEAEINDLPTSRTHSREKRVEYSDEEESGKGWRHEVGWESFRTRVAMFDSAETVRRLEPELRAVQEAIIKTSPNGVKVVVEWAVAVVLATRK